MTFLKVINEENGNSYPFNDVVILRAIKKLKGRDESVREDLIEIWENIKGIRFDEKRDLKYIK